MRSPSNPSIHPLLLTHLPPLKQGMREVSHIHTAPASRLPVATSILPWDPQDVRRALLAELQRGVRVVWPGPPLVVVGRGLLVAGMAGRLAGR